MIFILYGTGLIVNVRQHNFPRINTAVFYTQVPSLGEPGSSVGIATGYGLDGPGIESR